MLPSITGSDCLTWGFKQPQPPTRRYQCIALSTSCLAIHVVPRTMTDRSRDPQESGSNNLVRTATETRINTLQRRHDGLCVTEDGRHLNIPTPETRYG